MTHSPDRGDSNSAALSPLSGLCDMYSQTPVAYATGYMLPPLPRLRKMWVTTRPLARACDARARGARGPCYPKNGYENASRRCLLGIEVYCGHRAMFVESATKGASSVATLDSLIRAKKSLSL